MNRDNIEAGKTWGKWAESYALFGGVGAMIYPLVFYYLGWVAIDGRDDYLICRLTEKEKAKLAGEGEPTDWVRAVMFWNALMMCVYLCMHYVLYSRPDRQKTFERVGAFFAPVLILEIIFALVNFGLLGASICEDEDFMTAGILSTVVLIVVNLATLIAASIFFLSKTRV